MANWLWIVVILCCAAVATVFLGIYKNRKNIFKKKEKTPKNQKENVKNSSKKQKNKKPSKKTPTPIVPPVEEKPQEELVFEERVVEVVPKTNGVAQSYTPSKEFASQRIDYAPLSQASMRRRPRPQMPTPQQQIDDFDSFRMNNAYSMSIKEQIKNLSPEMKAIIFGNLLDKKDEF